MNRRELIVGAASLAVASVIPVTSPVADPVMIAPVIGAPFVWDQSELFVDETTHPVGMYWTGTLRAVSQDFLRA